MTTHFSGPDGRADRRHANGWPARRCSHRKAITAWLFLTPARLVLAAFTLYPMVQARTCR